MFEDLGVEAKNKEDEMKEVLPLSNIISTNISIQSSDGDNFKVDSDAAKKSVTIQTMLEDLGVEANNEEDEVKEVLPLPNIDSEVLRKVIDWCEQHKNDPEPEKEEESKDGERKQKQIVKLEGWDEEFMSTINYINKQGPSITLDIIIAANYLHVQGLIDITTMEVARKMENKTPEQIRELFKLENDLEIHDDETKDDDTMETNKRCDIWIANFHHSGT